MSYATPTVVIVHQADPNVDQYGTPTAATATRTTIPGAIIAPRVAAEVTGDGRSAVPVGLTLYAPPGTTVDPRDLIEVDSVIYEVDGEPAPWGNPFTDTDRGVEVALKRVDG